MYEIGPFIYIADTIISINNIKYVIIRANYVLDYNALL